MTNTKVRARRALGGLAIAAAASTAAVAPAIAAPAHHHAPTCDAAHLSVSVAGVDAGAGQRYTTLDIGSTHTCTITGDPTDLTFLDANGAPLATNAILEGAAAIPVTIDATTPAQLVLHTSPVDVDGQATLSPAALSFVLPGAHTPITVTWTSGEVDGNGTVQYGAIQAAS